MNDQKGFIGIALLVVLGLTIVGGGVYASRNPEKVAEWKNKFFEASTDVQANVNTNVDADVYANTNVSISWKFSDAGEVNNIPYTNVIAVINGKEYPAGKFEGSCSEIGASGGVDGKGLLTGQISAVQCWFAGGGNEIGVFGHEDGGVELMVGELSEGSAEEPFFRGDFEIKNTILF